MIIHNWDFVKPFFSPGRAFSEEKMILILVGGPGMLKPPEAWRSRSAGPLLAGKEWKLDGLGKEREMPRRSFVYCFIIGINLTLLAMALPAPAAGPVASAVDEFLSTLPKDFYTLSPKGLKAALDAGEPMAVVDVREASEFEAGHIEGAIHLPLRQLAEKLDQLPSDKNAPLAVICRTGTRSSYGTMALWLLGYRNLRNIAGGMVAWEKEGLPVIK